MAVPMGQGTPGVFEAMDVKVFGRIARMKWVSLLRPLHNSA